VAALFAAPNGPADASTNPMVLILRGARQGDLRQLRDKAVDSTAKPDHKANREIVTLKLGELELASFFEGDDLVLTGSKDLDRVIQTLDHKTPSMVDHPVRKLLFAGADFTTIAVGFVDVELVRKQAGTHQEKKPVTAKVLAPRVDADHVAAGLFPALPDKPSSDLPATPFTPALPVAPPADLPAVPSDQPDLNSLAAVPVPPASPDSASPDSKTPSPLDDLIEKLGTGVRRVEYRGGFAGETLASSYRIVVPAPRSGLYAKFAGPFVSPRDLPTMPEGTRSFTIVGLDAARVLAVADEMIALAMKASDNQPAPGAGAAGAPASGGCSDTEAAAKPASSPTKPASRSQSPCPAADHPARDLQAKKPSAKQDRPSEWKATRALIQQIGPRIVVSSKVPFSTWLNAGLKESIKQSTPKKLDLDFSKLWTPVTILEVKDAEVVRASLPALGLELKKGISAVLGSELNELPLTITELHRPYPGYELKAPVLLELAAGQTLREVAVTGKHQLALGNSRRDVNDALRAIDGKGKIYQPSPAVKRMLASLPDKLIGFSVEDTSDDLLESLNELLTDDVEPIDPPANGAPGPAGAAIAADEWLRHYKPSVFTATVDEMGFVFETRDSIPSISPAWLLLLFAL